MRFIQIEMLPSGRALVDVDRLTHAVPQEKARASSWVPST